MEFSNQVRLRGEYTIKPSSFERLSHSRNDLASLHDEGEIMLHTANIRRATVSRKQLYDNLVA